MAALAELGPREADRRCRTVADHRGVGTLSQRSHAASPWVRHGWFGASFWRRQQEPQAPVGSDELAKRFPRIRDRRWGHDDAGRRLVDGRYEPTSWSGCGRDDEAGGARRLGVGRGVEGGRDRDEVICVDREHRVRTSEGDASQEGWQVRRVDEVGPESDVVGEDL